MILTLRFEWPALTGAFTTFSPSGVTISPSPAVPGGPTPSAPIPVWEDPSNLKSPQRVRFSFDITFSSSVLDSFPTATNPNPVILELDATATNGGLQLNGASASTLFELLGGADPYFTNLDPSNSAQLPYLSQDLRVFPVTAGTSVLGSPAFTSDPYGSIQAFLYYINSNSTYTTPQTTDPLDLLPGQTGFETGDSSVYALASNGAQNYNFALARVRLRGLASDSATNVRVFFR
jgi:hypothetical protein